MAHDRRYASLDLWRGVACLMVVVFHATVYAARASTPGPIIAFVATWHHGVTLFFVISGYCIAAAADLTLERGVPLRTYFWRRFRRIFPPYWAAVIVTSAVLTLSASTRTLVGDPIGDVDISRIPAPWQLNPYQWAGTITLTEGWRSVLLWRGGPQWVLGQAWSLSYEEQFYALMGALLLLGSTRFFVGAAILSAGVLLRLLLWPELRVSGLFLDGLWLLFACGILVYYVRQHPRTRVWSLGALIALAGWGLTISNPLLRGRMIVAALFAILLIGLLRWDRTMASARVSRPLAWCGTLCYSLYLVHWPITKAIAAARQGETPWETLTITVPLALVCSLLVAWPFYYWIERPCLNAGWTHGPTPSNVPRSAVAAPPPLSVA